MQERWDTVHHLEAANVRAGLHTNSSLDIEPPSAEFLIPPGARKLFTWLVDENAANAPEDHSFVQHCYPTGEDKIEDEPAPRPGSGIAVTKEEMIKHAAEVRAAKVAELRTWLKYKCFQRRKRKFARNIMDCRWVINWKQEQLPNGQSRRIIRARLTLRGFKDRDAENLERYAGTSQRYSQRLLASEAANQCWPILSTDISKAFLQGVT